MHKKLLLFLIGISFSSLLFASDPLKAIAQEIDKDLKICSSNQDCIIKIDKHLSNLRQVQDKLKSYHMTQIPYTFSFENVSTLLGLNFAPAIFFIASKLYNQSNTTAIIPMTFFTFLWSLTQWIDYSHIKTKLTQLEEVIIFLEIKKKELEQN